MSQTEGEKRGPGRPLSFDRAEVVRTAMDLFWQRGFDRVSLSEIAAASQLPRASLYNSFESKERLYLEAIETYLAEHPSSVLREFSPDQDAARVFFALFGEFCRFLTAEGELRGCMAVNASNELIAEDGELGEQVRAVLSRHTSKFELVVKCAKRQGGLVNSASAATIASMVNVFIAGLSTVSKAGADERELRKLCREFLLQLGFQESRSRSSA